MSNIPNNYMNNSYFTDTLKRKRVIALIKATGIATQAFFNPVGAIALTIGLEPLCNAANDFCDWQNLGKAKKEYLDNYENILFEAESLKGLEEVDKRVYVGMASKVFLSLKDKDFCDCSLNTLIDIVSKEVKNVYKNTGSRDCEIIEDVVVYALSLIQFVVNDKQYLDYSINKDINIQRQIGGLKNEMECVKSEIVDLKQSNISANPNNHPIERQDKIIQEYSAHFTEPLYLHKGNENVNLKNLFVIPDVSSVYGEKMKSANLLEFLSATFKNQNKPLILLGDAGSGKTTIVSWLAYLYNVQKSSDISKNLFSDKQLIIVKLRDVSKSDIRDDGLFEAICKYLNVEPDRKFFRDKYLILDGMDEISLTENYVNYNQIFDKLYTNFADAFKLIITSRSSVVSNDTIIDKTGKEVYDVYRLNPFGYCNKQEWIANYEKWTGDTILSEVKEHILSTEEDSIYDYPQLMYMIAGEKQSGETWSLDNEWSIYHHIFYDVVFSREYDGKNHPFEKYRDTVYRVLEIIGYEMYLDYSETKVEKKVIKELLGELDDSHLKDSNELLDAFEKYGYGLGCYWKLGNDAEIEFYHNNIRDFFIAEYIFHELNKFFLPIVDNDKFVECCSRYDDKAENSLYDIACKLFNLLRGIPISREVVDFLSQRASFYLECNSERKKESFVEFLKNNVPFIKLEDIAGQATYIKYPFEVFLKKILFDMDIYHGFDKDSDSNVMDKISTFLNNVLTIIHAVLFNYEKDKYISVFGEDYVLRNQYITSVYICRQYDRYTHLGRAYLNAVDFNNAFLEGANLSGAFLEQADFSHADLTGIDLSNSILDKARILGTEMRESNLRNASFLGTYICNSDFVWCDFTGSHFGSTIFHGNDCESSYILVDEDDEENEFYSDSEFMSWFGKENFRIPGIGNSILGTFR